ncbi:MAG: transcriptional regulator [Chloroflexi bacterium]|nr:transcriptional regulator [Chloroflexota bacterium]
MSKVVSFRLKDEEMEALRRAARRLGRTPSETASILVGEALRQQDFAFVEFRDSPVGRQAYLQGTRLAVWQIAAIARDYDGDVNLTAAHLSVPVIQVKAALNYADAFPEEIEAAIEDNDVTVAQLRRLIPNLEVFEAGGAAST